MVQLPGEKVTVQEISEKLSDHLNFANRLLQFWTKIDTNVGWNRSKISPFAINVAFSMSVKSTRQFRSVIQLCERGEAADASIIARAMFETLLVIGFVLKPRFTPLRFNPDGTPQRNKKIPDGSLTREFRACLVFAHHELEGPRFAKKHASRPGMKRLARQIGTLTPREDKIMSFTQHIGETWKEILSKGPNTYSGLNISDLSRSLGKSFPKWYDKVYGFQSAHVHAADMLNHMQFDENGTVIPSWRDSVTSSREALLTGIAMMYEMAAITNQYIEFGIAMNSGLHAFHREYQQLVESH